MTILDPYTVVVYDDIELRTAITGVNTYNRIYFGANITMTVPIAIPLSKNGLIIDGTYENVTYTYTDRDSATAATSLYFYDYNSSVPTMNITMQNMNVNVRNYYGIILVGDSANAANTSINFIKVNCKGTQPFYNNFGITNIIDCNFEVGSGSRTGEVGEVHIVNIGGNTTINHTYTGFSTFFFRGGNGQGLNILPDANVVINCARNLLYFEGNGNVNVMPNASLTVNSPYGFSFSNTNGAQNILFDTNSTVVLNRTANTGGASIVFDSSFTVNNGANVLINSTSALTNPHIYSDVTGASLNINDPASFIVLSNGTRAFYFTGTCNLNISGRNINQWDAYTSSGDINNLPTYHWQKDNFLPVVLTGTATNTATSIASHNLTADEIAKFSTITNLQLRTLRILSVGYLPLLNINPIPEGHPTVSGTVEENTGVIVKAIGETHTTTSGADGKFSVNIVGNLVEDDDVNITATNNNYLYNIRTVKVVFPGELYIYFIPTQIPFTVKNPVHTNPLRYTRVPVDWTIQIYDSRVISSAWKLSASIHADLTSETNDVLPQSLVYVADDGVTTTTLTSTPIVVYTGVDNGGTTKITDVKWASDKGILFTVTMAHPVRANETYTTDIYFDLAP